MCDNNGNHVTTTHATWFMKFANKNFSFFFLLPSLNLIAFEHGRYDNTTIVIIKNLCVYSFSFYGVLLFLDTIFTFATLFRVCVFSHMALNAAYETCFLIADGRIFLFVRFSADHFQLTSKAKCKMQNNPSLGHQFTSMEFERTWKTPKWTNQITVFSLAAQ